MKKLLLPFLVLFFLASCGTESMTDMQPDVASSSDDLLGELIDSELQNQNMRIATAGSCHADCIEAGSGMFYPVSDMATGSAGPNIKSVSYSAYNTETHFVVDVTYAITAGRSNAEATITIAIGGHKVAYTEVSSGSMVSHRVALAQDWGGCDQVAFSIVQEELGKPVTFSESYSLIPVCPEVPLETGEGCTPAFWRQPNNIQYWTGFDPNDLYADVFGVDRAGTLLQNVAAFDGGATALASHSVAALLNATSSEVNYPLTVAEIIASVQAAFSSGDFESLRNEFERYNEAGCPSRISI